MVVHYYDAQSLIPTTTKTANYTAAVNDWVIVNGNAASPVITLPAAPAGSAPTVGVKRFDTLSGTPTFTAANTPTIAVSGSDAFLGGSTTPLQMLLQGQVYILQYDPSRTQWVVRSTDQPLSQLEPLESFAALPSAYTLASQTAAQKLLNTTTNGAITLPVGEYFFECGFSLTAMSATSGSYGFGFGGTATFTQAWSASTSKSSSGLVGGSVVFSWATAAQTSLILANTNTVGASLIKGAINVTAAGTLIPQVSLTQAAAAIVGVGSYFRIQSVNSAAAFGGNWS